MSQQTGLADPLLATGYFAIPRQRAFLFSQVRTPYLLLEIAFPEVHTSVSVGTRFGAAAWARCGLIIQRPELTRLQYSPNLDALDPALNPLT